MGASGASTFGERLRDHRRAAALTQEELAERAGLSRRTISDLERGLYLRPHLDTVRLLARALALEATEEADFLAAARQSAQGPSSVQPALVEHPTNLPDERTPFFGREQESTALTQLLEQSSERLVTLTGVGGTGKTRLALRVGSALLDAFQDGVFFCDLSALSDPALVLSTVAETLNVKAESEAGVLDSLIKHLRDKHVLVILDNFEQVIDAAPQVSTLTDSCRKLQILATSRVPLHLTREREYTVAPFPVPDMTELPPFEQLQQYDAVALFVDRARAAHHGFTLTPENAATVAAICSKLDGLPLAIELAAARIKLFPPIALLGRLDHRLKLLTGGARDRPSRQQTLRATIEWSYSLLTEEERALFSRLSVFVGGWTFEVAEAVCDSDDDLDVLDSMTSLVEKSMVRKAGEEEPRFSMLETIREYATEKLDERGETEAVRQRHAEAFLTLGEEIGPRVRGSNDPAMALHRLTDEQDNLRAALGWFVSNGDAERSLRLAGVLWHFWADRNLYAEGRRWLDAALALAAPSSTGVRALALRGALGMAGPQGDVARARQYGEESLALYRQIGDQEGIASMCNNLAIGCHSAGDIAGALSYLEESEALARQTANVGQTAQVLYTRAGILSDQGEEDEAVRLWEEGIALQRTLDSTLNLANNLGALAIHFREHGDYERAAVLIEDALVVAERLGDLQELSLLHAHRSTMRVYQGDIERAKVDMHTSLLMARSSGSVWAKLNALGNAILVTAISADFIKCARIRGAKEAGFESIGLSNPGRAQQIEESYVEMAVAHLGKEAWELERSEGRAMGLEEAVAYALEEGI